MALTVLEASLGRPLSSATRESPGRGGGGTSLGRALAVPDLRPHHPVPHRPPAVPMPGSAAPVTPPRPAVSSTSTPRAGAPPPPAINRPQEHGPTGREPDDLPAPRVEPSDPDPSPPTPVDTPPDDPSSPPPVYPFSTDQPTMPPSA